MEARISLHKLCAPALLLALCAALLLCGCSHKRVTQIERTHADTLITARTDSVAARDTLSAATFTVQADTVRESVTTFAVIDSTGRVKTAYVWRTCQASRIKNAMQTASRAATAERQSAASERQTAQTTAAEKKTETTAKTQPKRLLWSVVIPIFVLGYLLFELLRKRRANS